MKSSTHLAYTLMLIGLFIFFIFLFVFLNDSVRLSPELDASEKSRDCIINVPQAQCTGSDRTWCSGSCIKKECLDGSPWGCGQCGKVCVGGHNCVPGGPSEPSYVCRCPSDKPTECSLGKILTCIDTQTDPLHCGSCTKQCGDGEICVGGVCQCPTGQTFCSIKCVDTQTNNFNCGTCGNWCTSGSSCINGACTCSTGLTMCNGLCLNLQTNNQNCGTCGNACHFTQSCRNGECVRYGSQ